MESAQQGTVLSVRSIVVTAILAAIAVLLGATRLGFIPVPNPSGNATIMHVPAILAGVLEGPIAGLLVGGIFGLYSFLQATTPFFKDPLVAILPRLFIGITPYFAYRALRNISPEVGYALTAVIVGLVLWVLSIAFQFAPEDPELAYAGITLTGASALWAYRVMGLLIAGIGLWISYLLYRLIREGQMEMLALSVAAVVGTLTNTVLVVGMLILRGWFPAEVIIPAVIPQAVAEIVIAVAITVAVVGAWKRIEGGRGASSV